MRDRELASLREQVRRHQQVSDGLLAAVLDRRDITINGIVYRPA